MAFNSVWGFDPDEVIRAQTSRPDQRGVDEPTIVPLKSKLRGYQLASAYRLTSSAECSDCGSRSSTKGR
jgi:hypothetical protein